MYFRTPLCHAVVVVFLGGCALRDEVPENQTKGVVGSSLKVPPPRSAEFLRAFKQDLLSKSLDRLRSTTSKAPGNGRTLLKAQLMESLLAHGGLSRSDLDQLLKDLLSTHSLSCGGVHCRRVFELTASDVDSFLDEMLVSAKKNPLFRDAEHVKEYHVLISSLSKVEQTPWQRPTVDGISYLPNGEIDRTEGVGAFMDLPLAPHTRNLDVGGGEHDTNTRYLATRRVTNYVYDPFARSAAHNLGVLQEVQKKPVDSVTSMSILNVIDSKDARLQHIQLCHQSLKPNGVAYFKVWAGNQSGQGEVIAGGYQSNRSAASYLEEVAAVFGSKITRYDEALEAIIAYKL